MNVSRGGSGPFLSAMAGWFAGACVLGMSGRLAALTPPLPQVMILLSALVLILFGALHPGLRAWLAQVNLRGFVAFHLTRFVGVAFLLMYQRGLLTGEFAISAGWGDNITALSHNTPWYQAPEYFGRPLVDHLETVELDTAIDQAKPFRRNVRAPGEMPPPLPAGHARSSGAYQRTEMNAAPS